MITDLAELHDEIHQTLDAVVVAEGRRASNQVGDRDVLAKCSIHDFLTRSEVAVDIDFDLRIVLESVEMIQVRR